MGGGFQFFDILIFALVAAFLVFRLRSVLGRRDGHEGGYPDPFARRRPGEDGNGADAENDNVIRLPDRAPDGEAEAEQGPAFGDFADAEDDPLAAGLIQIRLADPSFERDTFLGGARAAFEMIVQAFANADRKTLRNLLSPQVLANFERAINDREQAGETVEHELVGLRPPALMEAGMEGDEARITVKFVSEQVSVTRDAEGAVVDGDPNFVDTVTDFWTFARDVRSSDPNWMLVATRSLD